MLKQELIGTKTRSIPNTSRATDVLRLMMPTVSREFAYATTPQREIRPYEGLKPTVPVYAAGSLTDPPVSVPKALSLSAQSCCVYLIVVPTHSIALSLPRLHSLLNSHQRTEALHYSHKSCSSPGQKLNSSNASPFQTHPGLFLVQQLHRRAREP